MKKDIRRESETENSAKDAGKGTGTSSGKENSDPKPTEMVTKVPEAEQPSGKTRNPEQIAVIKRVMDKTARKPSSASSEVTTRAQRRKTRVKTVQRQ